MSKEQKGQRSKPETAAAVRKAVTRLAGGPRKPDGSPSDLAEALIRAVMAEVGPLVDERDRRVRQLEKCRKSSRAKSGYFEELQRLSRGLAELRRTLADEPGTDWETLKRINGLWLGPAQSAERG